MKNKNDSQIVICKRSLYLEILFDKDLGNYDSHMKQMISDMNKPKFC